MEQYIAKKINIKNFDEQHSIIDKILNQIEYWNCSDFSGTVFSLQECFFRIMNIYEKEKYSEAFIFIWKMQ